MEFQVYEKTSSLQGLQRKLDILSTLVDKSHEAILQVRQELIAVLQEENQIQEMVVHARRQLESYELIFQGRASVEISFLQDMLEQY